MTERLLVVLLLSGSLFTVPAWSQSNDIASERSRVAEERIRVEAERIALEEKRRAEVAAEAEQLRTLDAEAEAERLRALEADAEAERLRVLEAEQARVQAEVEQQDIVQPKSDVVPATVATSATASRSDGETGSLGMSLMLEHLNVLGQLRDSGYVTDAEFERIKQRILNGEL